MKLIITLLSVIATLVPYAATAAEYISNEDLRQLIKEKPIWCRDLDSNGLCSSVTYHGLIKASSVDVSNYSLLSNVLKLRASGTSEFTKSGLCFTFSEAYAQAFATYITANDFARITTDDRQFPNKEQVEFNSRMADQIRPMFGKEYCARYESARYDASGNISHIKATFFLDNVQQSFPSILYTLFPADSREVRLKALSQQ